MENNDGDSRAFKFAATVLGHTNIIVIFLIALKAGYEPIRAFFFILAITVSRVISVIIRRREIIEALESLDNELRSL